MGDGIFGKNKNVKIIWSRHYLKYNFGTGHPFWVERGKEFLNKFKIQSAKFKIDYEIVEPKKASDEDILMVHSQQYLSRVKKLAQEYGMLSLDTPLNPGVLEATYWSVGGTILACELALQKEKAMNLLGGLHHARISDSSGFCVFNDHAIAIRKLQKEGRIKKAIIFDLDVHAGNGTQEIFYSDPLVFNISLHQDPTTLYPGTGFSWQKGEGAGEGFNLNVPLAPGTKGEEYLQQLDKVLPLYNDYSPDLVILILGVDTWKNDPLANLKLEEQDYYKIGKRFRRFEKLAILCAGGYSQETPDLWMRFIEGLVELRR